MSRSRQSSGGSLLSMILVLIVLLFFVVISLGLLRKNSNDGSIGVNVTTGKLKVDIVDEEGNSLVGDVLDFVDPDGDGKLYFEPGATFYTQGFQVKNIGDLSVGYTISVGDDENIDKVEFKEAFEFWLTTAPKDQEKAVKLQSYEGALEAAETSETYYLVVRMKESAGNEFQDKTYTGIGITVHAVQSAAENG